MKICLIQTDPQLRQENLRILSQVIQTTEADLYVLPELFTIGFDAAAQKRPQAAEQFPTGPTYQHILGLLLDRKSVVVCGMLEQYGSNFYNIAAVVGNGWADRYWQKNPASTTQGRVLPIGSGEYRKIPFSMQWSAGMMV
jgi:predicted amidohydrolase